MAKPEVEIDVDAETGRWFVDGMPMILVPQHFFMNNHSVMEDALGAERLAEVLAPAGYKSAYVWCKKQSELYGHTGEQVFVHYMRRLSQRGWGQFAVKAIDASRGTARIEVRNSAFLTEDAIKAGRRCCYAFAPWLKGAMEFACEQIGKPATVVAEEVQCTAQGHDHCLFEVRPA